MAGEQTKRILKLVLKMALTAGAIYIVIQKIDIKATLQTIGKLDVLWVMPAFFLYNISKMIGALRLQVFLRQIRMSISNKLSIKLCYIGMFYNLFLPGGIGGDGYKVFLLQRNFPGQPLRLVIAATLLDRISGLVSLLFLAFLMFNFTSGVEKLGQLWLYACLIACIVLCFPAFYLLYHLFFKSFVGGFWTTNLQSLTLQIIQVVAAFLILLSLNIQDHYLDYLGLFLVSSVVAVLPFTIGGIGARELVFIFGYEYLPIEKNTAVAFSLVFFLISALSSLLGAMVSAKSADFHVPNDQPVSSG